MSAEVMCCEIFIQLVLYTWICLVHACKNVQHSDCKLEYDYKELDI